MATPTYADDASSSNNSQSVNAQAVKTDNQGLEAFKDIIFGSTAGILGKYVEYPFDTIKVRLQSQSHEVGQPRLNGPLDAFRAAFRAPEGPLRSLYTGISAPLIGAAVETSSLFFSYRVAQDAFVRYTPAYSQQKQETGSVDLPFPILLLCGAASGAFTSLALTPIELVKCRMQVSTPHDHTTGTPQSPLKIIRSVLRSHGLLGFWHGQLGTLIRETGGSAAWFGAYEGVKILFRRSDPSIKRADDIKLWQQMLAGAAAGMSYNFFFYPADTIKSRMQTEDTSSTTRSAMQRSTFNSTARDIWHRQGLKGFYRGCGITVFRSAPSSAIIFSIYEALRKAFA